MPWAIFLCPQEVFGGGTVHERFAPKHSRDVGINAMAQIKSARGGDTVAWFRGTAAALTVVEDDAECFLLAEETTIDDNISGPDINPTRNALESAGIPGIHDNAAMTRRELVREICAIFQFSQRMDGIFGGGWKSRVGGSGLDIAWNNVPQVAKDDIEAVRVSFQSQFGDDWADIGASGTNQLRDVLRNAGERFLRQNPIRIGTETI